MFTDQGFQTLEPKQDRHTQMHAHYTAIQTDRRERTHYHAAFPGSNKTFSTVGRA